MAKQSKTKIKKTKVVKIHTTSNKNDSIVKEKNKIQKTTQVLLKKIKLVCVSAAILSLQS